MSTEFPRTFILSAGLVLTSTVLCHPAQASRWQQWVQTGVNYARQGASVVRSSRSAGGYDSGGSNGGGAEESVHAQPYSPLPQQASPSSGTYYDVHPDSMQVPQHSAPPSQPTQENHSYTATPSYGSPHRAYSTGLEEPQQSPIPPRYGATVRQQRMVRQSSKHSVDHGPTLSHKEPPPPTHANPPKSEPSSKTALIANHEFNTDWIQGQMERTLKQLQPK